MLTFMIPWNDFQLETCCQRQFFKEEYRGLIETFITWCNDSRLKINISKTIELMWPNAVCLFMSKFTMTNKTQSNSLYVLGQ